MKYEADYNKFSEILSDIVKFIKSFTATLKDFIHGFKSGLVYEGEAEG